MKPYAEMTKEELLALRKELAGKYREFQGRDLKLDMSRGKPSETQLNMTMPIMDTLRADSDLRTEGGVDCRNYGLMDGIPEAKNLWAQ